MEKKDLVVEREKVIIKTSIIGILTNILLVGFKAFIGFLASSISIIMDALNNLTDALSSIITIIGTKLSNKKPTKKYPFGYGRIEYLTSTLIAFIILFAGGSAIYESIKSLIEGSKAEYNTWSIIIISVAVVIKICLGLFFRYKGKKVDSDALKSSGTDALFDSILSLSTLIALIISLTTEIYIEGYLGILIGLFILKSGFDALKESLSNIIGNRLSNEDANKIKDVILNNNPDVLGAYDLIINNYGPNKKIGSVHVEVKDDLKARDIQVLERKIQAQIYKEFGIIMTVGIYASNNDTKISKDIKAYLFDEIKNMEHVIEIHGFYVDEINHFVLFDIIFDFEIENPYQEKDKLENKLEKRFPEFKFNIVIDTDFTD